MNSRALKTLSIALLSLGMLFLAACASKPSANPDIVISDLKTFYVGRNAADDVGVADLIAEKLREEGRTATVGSADNQPENVDALVNYEVYGPGFAGSLSNYTLSNYIQVTIDLDDPETGGRVVRKSSYFRGSTIPDGFLALMVNQLVLEILDSQGASAQ